mmetsp:Transcript_26017/g.54751  ORF Transcript_26017/g.54751 Transcript_26017/m.54751 type:complete len:481 (-) Transcript_26017:186-1628(-)|eukprot:CAMPEP_0168182466 /NCGR_PEP_ID=MMETSP0139_2-20121125/11910_1 /TAXON_ID=44445 /ORGANISM="Pseudo-nitzschia australis, Strain 10249 10 AB" /LENGTH=480 /DNA_ID=CAMNT_0008103401 /DNA_START=143 /DNA_END=1585 /DNA_ORIENTATION=+
MSKESATNALENEAGTDALDYCEPTEATPDRESLVEMHRSFKSVRTKSLIMQHRSKSDIETLARTIDARRKNRMKLKIFERSMFLEMCAKVAKEEGRNKSRFSAKGLEDLIENLREKIAKKPKSAGVYDKLTKLFGCLDSDSKILELFEEGLAYTNDAEENEFYFRDFVFYNTTTASKFWFLKTPIVFVTFWLVFFLLGSVVLFCEILENEDVCPTQSGLPSDGWMTSIYFATMTMSTVGYGDVSLYSQGQSNWMTLLAILYMLVSMGIAYTVFSSASEMTFNGVNQNCLLKKLKIHITEDKHASLHKQVRRLVLLRVVELVSYFLLLNFLGVMVAKAMVGRSDEPSQQWNWMTAIYWAVQTTTTIGYGDLDMPVNLRWFNILFAFFGTAFVGGVFGSLAGLKEEIQDHKNYTAWKRRELSKMMVYELQINDEILDQNEFVLGSLLVLQKVKTDDIVHVMDKFRELAGDKEYISINDMDL